jgi:hypothetical protein
MSRRKLARFTCIALCAVPLASMQTLARAEVIGAEQFISVMDRRAMVDRIDAVLARSEVQRELERLGVDPDQTGARIAALSDQELQSLAHDLEELPAGGSVLGVVGVVFIVLLILELVGVINIFNKI